MYKIAQHPFPCSRSRGWRGKSIWRFPRGHRSRFTHRSHRLFDLERQDERSFGYLDGSDGRCSSSVLDFSTGSQDLEEVGIEFNVTRKSCQIEAKALRKIAVPLVDDKAFLDLLEVE